MVKQSDLVTKKDLEIFGEKLEKRLEEKLDKKLDEKFDEKFDVKFAEYFGIIIKEINRIFDEKFDKFGVHFQSQQDKQDFDISTHESNLTAIKYELDDHGRRITGLEKRLTA